MKKIALLFSILALFAVACNNSNTDSKADNVVDYGRLSDRPDAPILYAILPENPVDNFDKKVKTDYYISDSIGSKTYIKFGTYSPINTWDELIRELENVYEWDSIYTNTPGMKYGMNYDDVDIVNSIAHLDLEKRMAYVENQYHDRIYITKDELKYLQKIYKEVDAESPLK